MRESHAVATGLPTGIRRDRLATRIASADPGTATKIERASDARWGELSGPREWFVDEIGQLRSAGECNDLAGSRMEGEGEGRPGTNGE